jgi:hypothetical protein
MYKLCSAVLVFLVLALGHATAASAPSDASASESEYLRAPRALGKGSGDDCYECDGNDPCGKKESGYYEHCSKKKFIQCSNGGCFEFRCGDGTVWDQDILSCSFPKMKSDDACGECEENPCTKENIKAGMYYHPHCEKSKKYLQCGGVGICFEMACSSGTKWDQDAHTCVMKKK